MTTSTGEKIRELRKKNNLTLAALADMAGSSKSYIWELENKNPPRPSGEKLAAIAAALEVTADYLLGADDAADESNAVDVAFYREYSRMPAETKKKLRQMAKLLDGS